MHGVAGWRAGTLLGMGQMIISAVALLVSGVTFALAFRAGRASDRRSRIPVLVFTENAERWWVLRNIGNGPALNVIVAVRWTNNGVAGPWKDPVRVPPIGRDGELELNWLGHTDIPILGATYEDFLAADTNSGSRTYTVTCQHDINRIVPRRVLPRWTVEETVSYWSDSIQESDLKPSQVPLEMENVGPQGLEP
jgi:hypothetical protein